MEINAELFASLYHEAVEPIVIEHMAASYCTDRTRDLVRAEGWFHYPTHRESFIADMASRLLGND